MTITNGYATLAEMRWNLSITDASDTKDDTTIEAVVFDVSRAIDRYCHRHFYTTTSDETRYYTPTDYCLCVIDDLNSLTSLAQDTTGARVYGTTLAATDYDLMPNNAALEAWPYTAIRTTPNGRYRFDRAQTLSVKVVGKFGWSAVPGEVHAACKLWSERLFKRKDAVFGVVGSGGMGQLLAIGEMDPDVKRLLSPPIRRL